MPCMCTDLVSVYRDTETPVIPVRSGTARLGAQAAIAPQNIDAKSSQSATFKLGKKNTSSEMFYHPLS